MNKSIYIKGYVCDVTRLFCEMVNVAGAPPKKDGGFGLGKAAGYGTLYKSRFEDPFRKAVRHVVEAYQLPDEMSKETIAYSANHSLIRIEVMGRRERSIPCLQGLKRRKRPRILVFIASHIWIYSHKKSDGQIRSEIEKGQSH